MPSSRPALFTLPFGLPGARDERLWGYLEDEDWASARVLLEDVVTPDTTTPTWLLLLAYVRFRDAVDVMPDELLEACQVALSLVDRALHHGAELSGVAPLRDAVERSLDEATREELRLLALSNEDLATAPLADVESLAFALLRSAPQRAAGVFEQLAGRQGPPLDAVTRLRAALARARAGALATALPALEQGLELDWSDPGLRRERAVLEDVLTTLIEARPAEALEPTWRRGEALGALTGLPFPSVWPNQERLLRRLVQLGARERAVALAARIEDERTELSTALRELLRHARAPAA